MEILDSARKHSVADDDIRHAVDQAIRHHDLDDGLVMLIGPSTTGDLIEVGIVTAAASEPKIVHAMPARAKFL
ncbi:MAG: hypothetical protein JJE52_17800 [Acidimicrobiia bacterium]|nr:hypothetical protein [Acidimicrobiia bacterium]